MKKERVKLYTFDLYGFKLNSFSEVRVVYEDDRDIDLFVSLDREVLNLEMDNLPDFIKERFQVTDISNILFRLSKDRENTGMTIHILRNIDLGSSVLNFVVDYRELSISLVKEDYKNILRIARD